MTEKKSQQSSLLQTLKPFLIGGTSGSIATLTIQPIDMIKVTIQINSEQMSNLKKAGKPYDHIHLSPSAVAKDIYKQGGFKLFYQGIDSAITRQIMYGSARLGGYRAIFEYIKQKNNGKVSIQEKAFASLAAGFLASIIGNPADLALVRMQNDATLPVNERRNYKNVFHAFYTIAKHEGVLALWRGLVPTISRAMSMNLGMLTSFDETKERINKMTGTTDLLSTRLISSAVAGFFGAFFCLPFDNAKTKMQKMKAGPDGKFPYKNIFDCLKNTVVNEGVTGLWVGFPVFYFRVAPHAMISLVTMELLTDLWNNMDKNKKQI